MLLRRLRRFLSNSIKDHLAAQQEEKLFSEEPIKKAPKDCQTYEELNQRILELETDPEKLYKKKIDYTEEDKAEAYFWEAEKEFRKAAQDYFNPDSLKVDPFNSQMIEKTKNIVRAMQLNQAVDFSREKEKVSSEYSNYNKYKRNYAYFKAAENDSADLGDTNPEKLMKEYYNNVSSNGDYLGTRYQAITRLEKSDTYIAPHLYEDAMKEINENNSILEDDNQECNEHFGRLSPHAKEDIYQLYQEGWNVKDLSFKFGILPSRVKIIIWQRRYFYDEVMPRFDRTTWRLALEKEFLYASRFGFVDYGLDLPLMAELEKGIPSVELTSTTLDYNPPKETKEQVQKELQKVKVPDMYFVPKYEVGKGARKYVVKEMVVNKGHSGMDINYQFKRILEWSETSPQRLPKQVREKLDQGPRKASRGKLRRKKIINY